MIIPNKTTYNFQQKIDLTMIGHIIVDLTGKGYIPAEYRMANTDQIVTGLDGTSMRKPEKWDLAVCFLKQENNQRIYVSDSQMSFYNVDAKDAFKLFEKVSEMMDKSNEPVKENNAAYFKEDSMDLPDRVID